MALFLHLQSRWQQVKLNARLHCSDLLLAPLSFTFKEVCDYIVPTWVIQDDLLTLRSTD